MNTNQFKLKVKTKKMKFNQIFSKIIGLALFFSFAANTTFCQNDKPLKTFEGRIIYDFIFKDKTGEMSDEECKSMFGDEQIYVIKNEKYKSNMNGMIGITQVYIGGDTIYNIYQGMDQIFWNDATTDTDEIIDYSLSENVMTVAGIQCDLLTINSKKGVSKYYFNKEYKVDPQYYSKHKFGFWSFCIEKTGALPIKSITDTQAFYIETTAKQVKEVLIDDKEFFIPNYPRVKSPE